MLTVEAVAELLDVHPQTVRGWLRDGELKGIAFGGRTGWRIEESDLEEFKTRKRRQTEEAQIAGEPLAEQASASEGS